MKKIRLSKADLLSALLCALIIIPGIAVWDRLPDRIATNFSINGQPQQYYSKGFTVFGIPVIMGVLQLILCLITNLFHQKEKRDIINIGIRFIYPAILYFVEFFILLYALGQLRNVTSAACTFMAVTFVITGNYLPKLRRNMFFGIRTPHTLMNQEVWDKTQRFTGILMIICGIAMLPFALTSNYIAVIIILAVKMIAPFIYSEMVYRSEKTKAHE